MSVSDCEMSPIFAIISDNMCLKENESQNVNTKNEAEMLLRPKKKRGRPKGSKNVKKGAGKLDSKEKGIIGMIKDQEIPLHSNEKKNSDLMITQKMVEAVLSDIEPGEIVSRTNYDEQKVAQSSVENFNMIIAHTSHDDKVIGQPSSDKLSTISKNKRGRPKGSKSKRKYVRKENECNLCSSRFKTSHGLKVHKRVRHKENLNAQGKPECPYCDYEYQDMIKFERHINNHTGNRPFECDHCDYKSLTKHELKRHKNYKHTDTKKYSCPECDRGFVEKTKLTRHMLIHSGERSWPCSRCPQAYYLLSKLLTRIMSPGVSEQVPR